jgi:hypothetical protein
MTATMDWAEYAARDFEKPDPLTVLGFEPVCKPRVLARLSGVPEADLPPMCGGCPQERFLNLPDEDLDVLYGGAGGGGKGGRCPDRAAPSYNSSMETKVLTPKGFKLIGDIKVGDAVCNPDGTTAKVIKVIDNGQKQFFRVTLADGSSVEADEDHLWAISVSGNRKRRKQDIPVIPQGLRPEDEWNLRVQTRCRVVNTLELRELVARADDDKARGLRPRYVQIPLTNPVALTGAKGRWEIFSPYILGALIGDGSIGSDSIGITGIDAPVFDRIRDELPGHLQLAGQQRADHCPAYRITRRHEVTDEESSTAFLAELNRLLVLRSWRQADLVAAGLGTQAYLSAIMSGRKRPSGKFVARLDEALGADGSLDSAHADHAGATAADLLRRDGLAGLHSWDKFIPERIKLAPIDERFAFVQGLMDTDGHMDERGHVEFVSVSERLASDLRDVLHSLGYRATMTTKKTSYSHQGERKEGRLAYRLYVQGRHMDRLFHMPRKRERVAQFNGGDVEPWHRIVSVEPSGVDNSRCITVDNLNHLYVTDDCIVTHNSASLLALAIRTCIRFPGIQIFWFRKTFPQLNQSVLRNLARYNYGKAVGGIWNGSKYELRFPGNSILTFAHAKNMEEAAALSSAEINMLVIDERTTMPPEVVDFLYTRIRSGVEGVPCLGARSASNPGHIGHGVVKDDYVDATDYGTKEIVDKAGRRRIFIPAKASDNPYVGDYEKSLEGIADPDLRARIKDGDWSAMPDAAFPDWKRDRIVVPPFELPESWQRRGGMDYGWAAPSVYLAAAKDGDGRLWFYRELTMVQTPEREQARLILDANAGHHVMAIAADPAMWGKTGSSLPPADQMATEGLHLTKADNDRLGGKARMHTYLAEAPACAYHRELGWATCPLLHVLDGACPQFTKTMGELPRDPHRPEDVDTDGPDHWYDSGRYLIMSIGGGPEFLIHPTEPKSLAVEVLQPLGRTMAVRPQDDTRQRNWWDDDETPSAGRTAVSPFI